MTYKELLKALEQLDPSRLEDNVTIWDPSQEEFFVVGETNTAEQLFEDAIDPGHFYLVLTEPYLEISREQVQSLVSNAFGFIDSSGNVMTTEEVAFHDDSFTISDVYGEEYTYLYEAAELGDDCVLLQRKNNPGTLERLTILKIAQDSASLLE